MPSSRNPYAWVQLTRKQIDATLAVASGIDRQHGELNRYLPQSVIGWPFRQPLHDLIAKLRELAPNRPWGCCTRAWGLAISKSSASGSSW
jgi:hypothetical protein